MNCLLTPNSRANPTPNTSRRYGLDGWAGNSINIFESQEVTLVLDSDDEPLQKTKPSKKILSEDEGTSKTFGTCLRLIFCARQLPKSIHVSNASLIYSILTSKFRRLKRKAPVLVSSDEEECSPPKKKTTAAR